MSSGKSGDTAVTSSREHRVVPGLDVRVGQIWRDHIPASLRGPAGVVVQRYFVVDEIKTEYHKRRKKVCLVAHGTELLGVEGDFTRTDRKTKILVDSLLSGRREFELVIDRSSEQLPTSEELESFSAFILSVLFQVFPRLFEDYPEEGCTLEGEEHPDVVLGLLVEEARSFLLRHQSGHIQLEEAERPGKSFSLVRMLYLGGLVGLGQGTGSLEDVQSVEVTNRGFEWLENTR